MDFLKNCTLQDTLFQIEWLKSQILHFLDILIFIVGKQYYFHAIFSEVAQIISRPVFSPSKMAQNRSLGTLNFFWNSFLVFVRVQLPNKTLMSAPVSIFYCFQWCEKNR